MNEKQLMTLKQNNEESRTLTRTALSSALLKLITEKEYSKISISELCSKAGVSRTAFYRNYETMDDVLSDKIIDYAYRMRTYKSNSIYDNWLNIFTMVSENISEFEVMVKAKLEYKILEALNMYLPIEPKERTAQATWDAIAYSLIIQWVVHKTPASAEEMAQIAYEETKNLKTYWHKQ